jgi:N utilization substance protein B
VQTLFEWDVHQARGTPNVDSPETALLRNTWECAPATRDHAYTVALLRGVLQNRARLDRAIEAAASGWTIDAIARADRTLLRVAVFELLSVTHPEAPPIRDVIDEAVDLTRQLCNESSARFVNRVLVSVYLNAVYQRLQRVR